MASRMVDPQSHHVREVTILMNRDTLIPTLAAVQCCESRMRWLDPPELRVCSPSLDVNRSRTAAIHCFSPMLMPNKSCILAANPIRYIENLLKNKNYHFLTRFHFHAKNKVRERQALAFQILKAHYFTAHDHAQEMVTLAHKKNLPADKMEQVKRNMQEYVISQHK